MALTAIRLLKDAYDREVIRLHSLNDDFSCGISRGFNEAGAGCTQSNRSICPCLLGARTFIASLSAWRDRISDFTEDSIPKVLRNFIPKAGDVGCSIPFPIPHLAVITKWLPLSPNQKPFLRKMSSWAEDIGEERWAQLTESIDSVRRRVTDPDAERTA